MQANHSGCVSEHTLGCVDLNTGRRFLSAAVRTRGGEPISTITFSRRPHVTHNKRIIIGDEPEHVEEKLNITSPQLLHPEL